MSQGVYCIVVSLEKSQNIEIGSIKQSFPEGFYCYVNSAKNLKKALENHLSDSGRKTRIDSLLKKGSVINHKTIRTSKNIECKINKQIKKLSNRPIEFPVRCRCGSHLHYFTECPLFMREFHAIFEEFKP